MMRLKHTHGGTQEISIRNHTPTPNLYQRRIERKTDRRSERRWQLPLNKATPRVRNYFGVRDGRPLCVDDLTELQLPKGLSRVTRPRRSIFTIRSETEGTKSASLF